MSKFSDRLRELRLEKKLTQKQAAEIFKTNNSSISDWECGRAEPGIEIIIAICKYFGVTADYLLGITDY